MNASLAVAIPTSEKLQLPLRGPISTLGLVFTSKRGRTSTHQLVCEGRSYWTVADKSSYAHKVALDFVLWKIGKPCAVVIKRLNHSEVRCVVVDAVTFAEASRRAGMSPASQTGVSAEPARLREIAHDLGLPSSWADRVYRRDTSQGHVASRRLLTRGQRLYPFFGEELTLTELVRVANNGLPEQTLYQRLTAFRMPAEEAVFERHLVRLPRGQNRYQHIGEHTS